MITSTATSTATPSLFHSVLPAYPLLCKGPLATLSVSLLDL